MDKTNPSEQKCVKPEITMVMSHPSTLTCYKCHQHSIPAPEQATHETKYICRYCSPVVHAETEAELSFDEAQFMPSAVLSRMTREQKLAFIISHSHRIMQHGAPGINLARKLGKRWACNATLERIRALPDKYRMALILTSWANLSAKEAGEILGIKPKSVRDLAGRARKILAKTE